jgi:hypothetical protein
MREVPLVPTEVEQFGLVIEIVGYIECSYIECTCSSIYSRNSARSATIHSGQSGQ